MNAAYKQTQGRIINLQIIKRTFPRVSQVIHTFGEFIEEPCVDCSEAAVALSRSLTNLEVKKRKMGKLKAKAKNTARPFPS